MQHPNIQSLSSKQKSKKIKTQQEKNLSIETEPELTQMKISTKVK